MAITDKLIGGFKVATARGARPNVTAPPGQPAPRPSGDRLKLPTPTRTTFSEEARRIQERALRGESAVVRLGSVVFICANLDAWVLHPQDGFARCLVREGRKQPLGISETKTRFAVEWNADYTVNGRLIAVTERGRAPVLSIMGYPAAEQAACAGPQY